MNLRAARILATHLPNGLTHPGNNDRPPTHIPLPGLSTTGIPPSMAAHFATQAGLPNTDMATLLAEAIIHLLETNSIELIDRADLLTLQAAAAQPPTGTRHITVHCHCDTTHTTPLLELAVGNTNQVHIPAAAVLRTLARRNPDCPHEAT